MIIITLPVGQKPEDLSIHIISDNGTYKHSSWKELVSESRLWEYRKNGPVHIDTWGTEDYEWLPNEAKDALRFKIDDHGQVLQLVSTKNMAKWEKIKTAEEDLESES